MSRKKQPDAWAFEDVPVVSFNAKGWLRDYEAAGGICTVIPDGVRTMTSFTDRNRDKQERACDLVMMLVNQPDRMRAVRDVIITRP